MIKNNSLFKNISLFLCLVPMLLLSLFCLVPHTRDMIVSADYVSSNYTFVGSNINTYATFYQSNQSTASSNHFINVNCNFSFTDGVYSARVFGTFLRSAENGIYSFDWSTSDYFTDIPLVDGEIVPPFFGVISSGYGIKVLVVRSGDVTSNIVRVQLKSSSYSIYNCNDIFYYDSNDNYVRFSFMVTTTASSYWSNFRFTDRSYFISLNQSDNSYYESGYNNGYNQGLADGNSQGYQDGYTTGNSVGYENGYNDGLNATNNYSFLSLIGAVIDVPVSAFTNLLNFNLLGFNMLAFITGLLTLALIIFIVKLFLGGK